MPRGTWGSPGNWSAYKTSSVLEEMTYRACWDGFKHFLSLYGTCDWREREGGVGMLKSKIKPLQSLELEETA